MIWMAIPGFPGCDASRDGRVRKRVGRKTVAVHPTKNRKGYLVVNLRNESGVFVTRSVNRFVLMAFVGLPVAGQEAAHRNGSKADNNLSNLYWGTRAEQEADKRRHATGGFRGVKNPGARFTEKQVATIKARLITGHRNTTAIAREYGVYPSTIDDIKHGRTWAWIKGGTAHG